MTNKFAQLSDFIAEHNPDVLVITETWFSDAVTDNEFTPPDYICFRKDRKLHYYTEGTYKQESRGGVLLLVKNYLHPTLYTQGDCDAEILWVQINPRTNIRWLIGGCYRPEEDEDHILKKITNSINTVDSDNCILLGDFNFRNIDWDQAVGTNERERLFLDTIQDNLLSQVVTEPTRGENILDLALVGDTSTVHNVTVGPKFSTSDHQIVQVKLHCPLPRINLSPRKVYLYSKGDYAALNTELSNINWERLFGKRSVESCWDIFKDQYDVLVDKHVPHKMVKPGQRNKPPWTRYKTVQKAKSNKRRKWVQFKKSKLESDRLLFEQEIPVVEETIKKAKAHYEDKLVSQLHDNPKRFWNYTKHFSKSSATVEVLENEGKKVTEDNEKAEILNNYFVSVLTKEKPPDFSLPKAENVPNLLLEITVTPEMIREKLKKLKPNKASGPDKVNINVLRSCMHFDVPLALLFNKSIQTSQIPQDWRDANVTPLYKKGSRSSPGNYRPVSLTSQVVKILERIFQDSLLQLIRKNKTINCNQHGFQDRCSCITQLLECFNDWTDNVDRGLETDIIYLDFAKAFDTVPHLRLLHKLRLVGIRNKCLYWINSFLSGRRQRVVLRKGMSDWKNITSGVPQGSILGPILFLIYVNDLPESVLSTAKMFADDTKIYNNISSLSDCELLQQDLNSLSAWSKLWLLRFNETKCVVLKVRQSINYLYTLNGSYLQEAESQRDLGVLVSTIKCQKSKPENRAHKKMLYVFFRKKNLYPVQIYSETSARIREPSMEPLA